MAKCSQERIVHSVGNLPHLSQALIQVKGVLKGVLYQNCHGNFELLLSIISTFCCLKLWERKKKGISME